MKKVKLNFKSLGKVAFPSLSPQNININMMPFVIGDSKSLIPEHRKYWSIISACKPELDQMGKIGYLSINESFVPKGTTQRRPGIHTDRESNSIKSAWGGAWGGGWGGGRDNNGELIGGIYMASNVANTCRLWDTCIKNPKHLGNCSHLESELEQYPKYVMDENELIWFTDSCPHESMPMTESAYRQWIRFVTKDVSVWYTEHSSPNPLGIKPSQDCEIITKSKFETVK